MHDTATIANNRNGAGRDCGIV